MVVSLPSARILLTPGLRSQPLTRQTSSSRERLLDAAKRLFAAQGYEQTATSAIAREAGTSESQLMRYFGGKVGLLEALFDDAWDHLNARVERALKKGGGDRESLLDAIQTVVGVLARDPNLATLLMFEGRRLRGDEPRMRLSRGFTKFAESIRQLVENAQVAGEIDPAFDDSAVTSAILGAAESLMRDRLVAKSIGRRVFAEREIRRTLSGMLDGLRLRPNHHAGSKNR
jgi:AcrR family transcriptional regulator